MKRFLVALLLAVAWPLAAGAHEDGVDLKRLPLGDGKLGNAPQVGHIWPCRVDPNGGGAFRDGPWIKADGTFDFTAKAIVQGDVQWRSVYSFTLNGARRDVSTIDLPNHGTGVFPIAPGSAAFQYDRNPNSIQKQHIVLDLPANPVLAPASGCAPGAVGVLLTGAVLFNALDAPGRDAVAHETQDKCQGHPQISGAYHYHWITTCIDDKRQPDGHSALVGYAIDGFGIFGHYGEGGKLLKSADLDECHGHAHAIAWDGKTVVMYHYHATWDFPYTVGCLRGAYDRDAARKLGGGPPRGMRGPPPWP